PNRQVVLLVEVDDAAVERDLAAGAVGMDGLDAHAAAVVVFVFLDARLRSIQPVFEFPGVAILIDQVTDTGFGDAVPAGLQGPRVARVHGNEPHGPQEARGVHAHQAVVPPRHVTNLLAGRGLGLYPTEIHTERAWADLHRD